MKLGIKPLWASEIENVPVSITKRHFPEMRHLGDITKINGAEIEPVDIITFGSPCQDLSISGRRAGLVGKKSSLFNEAVRIIKEMRIATKGQYPKRIVWENVPGAFNTRKGADFKTVIEEIARIAEPGISIPGLASRERWMAAGAVVGDSWSLAWRVLDAQYWGVPQRRRRIFLVADFGTQRAGEILFRQEMLPGDSAEGKATGENTSKDVKRGISEPIPINLQTATELGIGEEGDVAYTLQEKHSHAVAVWPEKTGSIIARADSSPCIVRGQPFVCEEYTMNLGSQADRIQVNADKAVALKSGGGGGGAKTGLYCLPTYCLVGNTIDRSHKSGGNGPGVKEDMCYTLNTMDRHAVTVPFRRNAFGVYEEGDIGKTICVNDDVTSSDLVVSQYAVRRLTPVECERLQGYPDGWTEYGHDGKVISDFQRYKCLGNSLAIPCAVFVLGGM